MAVDIPQGRDLNIVRLNRRWGEVQIPRIGRVRFRWTRDLPVGKRANADNRITGARLVKDSLGRHIAFRVQTLEPVPDPHTARTYGLIAVEDLHITNMTRSAKGIVEENVAAKAGLNRSIAQEAWGRTTAMLAYKSARNGGTLAKVPAPYTSQRCHACGFVTPGSREDQAPRSCARTAGADGPATPTRTRPGTSCTCTGWAMRSSRLPGGQSSGGSNRPTHRRKPGGNLPRSRGSELQWLDIHDGARYLVAEVRESAGGGFYRARGDIKRLL